jgi:hypothetical protein
MGDVPTEAGDSLVGIKIIQSYDAGTKVIALQADNRL